MLKKPNKFDVIACFLILILVSSSIYLSKDFILECIKGTLLLKIFTSIVLVFVIFFCIIYGFILCYFIKNNAK